MRPGNASQRLVSQAGRTLPGIAPAIGKRRIEFCEFHQLGCISPPVNGTKKVGGFSIRLEGNRQRPGAARHASNAFDRVVLERSLVMRREHGTQVGAQILAHSDPGRGIAAKRAYDDAVDGLGGVQLSVTFSTGDGRKSWQSVDKTNVHVSSRHTPSGQLMRWQVSWLAGRCAILPSQPCRPVAFRILLAAYSCGGSHGLDPDGSHRVPFSPFAFRRGDHHFPTVVFPRAHRNEFFEPTDTSVTGARGFPIEALAITYVM